MQHRLYRGVLFLAVLLVVFGVGSGSVGATDHPDAGKVIWVGDFETGNRLQFKDTPWNTAGGAFPPVVVSDPAFVRSGRYAVRMTIPGPADSDVGICCGGRSEIEPKIGDIHPGDDLYFGFSTLLGHGFPISARWQVITQWKGKAEGSPPLELSIEDGQYALTGGYGHPDGPRRFDVPIGPALTDRWVNWVFHIKFSPDPETGYVEVWQANRLVIPRFQPASGTMYPDADGSSSYLKFGYYRDADITPSGTVYFDDWRVATSRCAVFRHGA